MTRLLTLALGSFLLFTLTTAGCDPQGAPAPHDDGGEIGAVSGAIKGGYTDTTSRGVVGIAILNNGFGICSGTLIAPNLVLTAQHCVAPVLDEEGGGVSCAKTSFGEQHQPGQLYVTTLAQMPQSQTGWYGVREIIVAPGTSGFCGQDMALMILAESIPADEATPLTPRVDAVVVAETPWLQASGEEYSAIGYGSVNDYGQGSGLRRRRDNLYATCVHEDCPAYAVGVKEWMGDKGICSGDSGGPAIDTQGRVIGVVSRGGYGCTSPIYGSVAAWASWIMSVGEQAVAVGDYETPNWVLGRPTDHRFYGPIGFECAGDYECPSDYCVDGMCTRFCDTEEMRCPDAFFCAPQGTCQVLPVGGTCTQESDCGGGVCQDGVCSRTCDNVTGCPEGYICDGTCNLLPVGAECNAEISCEAGSCDLEAGLCTRACSDVAPCPNGWACAGDGQCGLIPVGDVCEVDDVCGGGFCDILAGNCTRSCDELAPCPEGWECTEDGACKLIPEPEVVSSGCQGGGSTVPAALLLSLGMVALASRRPRIRVANVRRQS